MSRTATTIQNVLPKEILNDFFCRISEATFEEKKSVALPVEILKKLMIDFSATARHSKEFSEVIPEDFSEHFQMILEWVLYKMSQKNFLNNFTEIFHKKSSSIFRENWEKKFPGGLCKKYEFPEELSDELFCEISENYKLDLP